MSDFVSQVKIVPAPQEAVFEKLSDWTSLNEYGNLLPSDKISDFVSDRDSCHFKLNMAGLGSMGVRIEERVPFKTIKLVSEDSPVSFNAWIQLKEKDLESCYMKLTLRAELPFFLKGMLSRPLQEGIDKFADILSGGMIHY